MHFIVTALPGCLLQTGDVFFSSASSPCLLKSQQLAEDKAVTSPSQSFVSSGHRARLDTCPRLSATRKQLLFSDDEP